MNWINIDGTLLNLDAVVAVKLDEGGGKFVVATAQRDIHLPLNNATRPAFEWLADQCAVSFDAGFPGEPAPPQLSQPAWRMLIRIERHEQRTGLPGFPIDDDDMETTIELERQTYIKTSVHEAWLTDNGRQFLAEHRENLAEEDESGTN